MEVYEWNDRKLLLKLLGRLWEQDREVYYAVKERLIILPIGEATKAGLTVLPGSAEQFIVKEAQQLGLLDGKEGGK